jgi:hypothetical protein
MQLFQPLYCVLLKHESIQRGFSQPPAPSARARGPEKCLWSETQDESTPGDLPLNLARRVGPISLSLDEVNSEQLIHAGVHDETALKS